MCKNDRYIEYNAFKTAQKKKTMKMKKNTALSVVGQHDYNLFIQLLLFTASRV